MIKSIIAKAGALLAVLILTFGMCLADITEKSPAVLNVKAADEPYAMTETYRSGKFYKNLLKLELSGDEAHDVLAVAMSQVGYHEGNSNADFHGESRTGTRDFVEYNVLYGKVDNGQGNGLSYGYYWCASFVNWCLRMAGVSESASGSEISCRRWYNDCKTAGIFRSKNGYLPVAGDLIFFKDSGSTLASTHIGLVRYTDGKYVYTVEGNTSNGSEYSSNGEYVALKKHLITSKYIVGYASPRYERGSAPRTVDYSGGFLSLGEYICEREVEFFKDAELSLSQGDIPAFSVFSVISLADGVIKVSLDGTEGYIAKNADVIQLTSKETVYTINYLNDDGSMMYMPQYRRVGEAKNIYANQPKRSGSGFVGWRYGESILSPADKLYAPDGDVTLQAVWDGNYYVVSFQDSDNRLIHQIQGYYGTKYEMPSPITAPEGYVFFGWDSEPDGVVRGNVTYTAVYISESELENAGAETDTATESETEDHADVRKPSDRGCMSSASGRFAAASCVLIALFLVYIKKSPQKDEKEVKP